MCDVSIIIPTYNRVESLLETCKSLEIQSYPKDKYEVLVVDDGSADHTREIADKPYPYKLRYIYQSNQGSAVARNTGAMNSSGDLLIFLDDDMWVEPNYISGLVEEHQKYSRIVGMGCFLPYIPKEQSLFNKIYQRTMCVASEEPSSFVNFTECVTNNLSVERGNFFEIGMMQDVAGDGPTWWGDVDFGYRAYRCGYRFRRSSKAKCVHRDPTVEDLSSAVERYYKTAYTAIPLFIKHPDIEKYLPMFYDKSPINWRQDSPGLIIRKIARCIASHKYSLGIMKIFVNFFEKSYPSVYLLDCFYRWILGGYLYRGYHDGLRAFEDTLHPTTDLSFG